MRIDGLADNGNYKYDDGGADGDDDDDDDDAADTNTHRRMYAQLTIPLSAFQQQSARFFCEWTRKEDARQKCDNK